MKRYIVIAIIAMMTVISCTDKMPADRMGDRGAVCLLVSMSKTKAAEAVASTAVVGLYKESGEQVAEYGIDEVPDLLYLPVGKYFVSVMAGEILKPEPEVISDSINSFEGSSCFEIVDGEVDSVIVEATAVNSAVSVTFHESVAEYFQAGYKLCVYADSTNFVEYTAENSGEVYYFLMPGDTASLTWSFSGVIELSGKPVCNSGTIENVRRATLYKFSPKFSMSNGFLSLEAVMDDGVEEYGYNIEIDPYVGKLLPSEPSEIWSAHAKVKAEVKETAGNPSPKVEFVYSAGTRWDHVAATRVAKGRYEATLTGLQGGSQYIYKLYVDGNQAGEQMTFTTEPAAQIPNSGFEVASNEESNKYTSFFDPSSSVPGCSTKYWDSGNSASASFGIIVCDTSGDVPPGIGSSRSAVLTSHFVNVIIVKKLAAGNLFVGSFGGMDGMNGKVNFGRPWTSKSRPSAVRLWYKYKGCKISNTSDDVPLTKNDYDLFKMEFALGNWPASKYGGTAENPVQVNTADKKTLWVIENLPETVAACRFEGRSNDMLSEWEQVTLPFVYKSETQYPSMLYVSLAASKYGDNFVGGDGSKLYVDEIELIYE